jgi:MFS transporter, ACDE family, multidrug resistance protein
VSARPASPAAGAGRRSIGLATQASAPAVVDPRAAARSTVLLIALRIGYAYNWFDTGPALPSIGASFAVGPAQLGVLAAAFLVGAGVLQVPAGLLSIRFGARTVSLAGVGLLAAAGIAAAAAPSFLVLLALRLAAGAGAALFFSPAIGLVSSLYPPGRRGLPLGTFTTAFSTGAALGIVGSSVLVPLVGWRGALLVGGAVLGLLAVAAHLAIPRSAGAPPARAPRPGVPVALRHPAVWAIGFAFVGLEGASYATGQFIVPWGEAVRGWSILLAGVVGMMFVFPSTFGGPVGGPVAERHRNHRTQLALGVVGGAVVLAVLPWAGLAAALAIGIFFSFSYGFVFGVMYVVPHFWPDLPSDEVPLAIGLLNSVQLTGGAIVASAFGAVVGAYSYEAGWEFLAAAMVVSLLVLFALRPTGAAGGPPGAAGPGPHAAPGP